MDVELYRALAEARRPLRAFADSTEVAQLVAGIETAMEVQLIAHARELGEAALIRATGGEPAYDSKDYVVENGSGADVHLHGPGYPVLIPIRVADSENYWLGPVMNVWGREPLVLAYEERVHWQDAPGVLGTMIRDAWTEPSSAGEHARR